MWVVMAPATSQLLRKTKFKRGSGDETWNFKPARDREAPEFNKYRPRVL